jgi:hypothetical protein
MSRITKLEKQTQRQALISKAVANFFGGITKIKD